MRYMFSLGEGYFEQPSRYLDKRGAKVVQTPKRICGMSIVLESFGYLSIISSTPGQNIATDHGSRLHMAAQK